MIFIWISSLYFISLFWTWLQRVIQFSFACVFEFRDSLQNTWDLDLVVQNRWRLGWVALKASAQLLTLPGLDLRLGLRTRQERCALFSMAAAVKGSARGSPGWGWVSGSASGRWTDATRPQAGSRGRCGERDWWSWGAGGCDGNARLEKGGRSRRGHHSWSPR